MAYYLFTTESGRAMTLNTHKQYGQVELETFFQKCHSKSIENVLHELSQHQIGRCFTQLPPSYDFRIHLFNNGTFTIQRVNKYSIVKFGEDGSLKKVTGQTYDSKEEAERFLHLIQQDMKEDLFITEK